MAASYKKIVVKKLQNIGEKVTRDTLYWKNLEFPTTFKEHGAVTSINFSPVEPYNFAATNSSRVQIYDSESVQIERTISRFRQTAYSGSYRSDGKLLVAGGEEPSVKLFDLEHKSMLRMFTGHTQPVHVTKFLSTNIHILSGSDDMTCRIWDMASEKELIQYKEHKDYIRTGATSKASKDIVMTGGYDHRALMYDTRTPSSVLSVNHGAPIESVLMYPAGGLFLTAGGEQIKVWDALAGGRLLHQFSNHHKTITSLCFACSHQRLLSASLDRHVKIYDVTTYKVVHTLDYPGQILSLAVSPDDTCVAVGMTDGLLSVQKRKPDVDHVQQQRIKERKQKASYRYVVNSGTYAPSKQDQVIEHQRKQQLASYDKYFKRFEHSKALDAAMNLQLRRSSPEVTVSVMRELIRRDGLRRALAGRDQQSVGIILKFIQKNLSNPQLMATLLDVTFLMLELYSSQIGQDPQDDQRWRRLLETIATETKYMKQMYQLMGIMDTLFSASSQPSQDVSSAGLVSLREPRNSATVS